MSSQILKMDSKTPLFKSIELIFLDWMINMLSSSTWMRRCVLQTHAVLISKYLYLLGMLVMIGCFLGVVSGYIFYLLLLAVR